MPPVPDTTPDDFAFAPVTGASLGQAYQRSIAVTGLGVPAPISGTMRFRINGGAWRTAPAFVVNEDSVDVEHRASETPATIVQASLTIGTLTRSFSIETAAAPVFTEQPSIDPPSGEVGDTFTGDLGAVSGGAIVSHAWLLDGVSIETLALTLLVQDAGQLVLRSRADGPGGTTFATSAAVAVAAAAPTPPVYSLAADVTLSEGDAGTRNFTFTVNRVNDTSAAGAVSWAVAGAGGNPAAASDFVGGALPSGTATFAAGETATQINVPVQGDSDVEPDEGFTVTLTAVTLGAGTIGAAAALGTIANDDVAPGTFDPVSFIPPDSPAAAPAQWASYSLPSAIGTNTPTITNQTQLNAVLTNANASGIHYVAGGVYTSFNHTVYHTLRLILIAADPANPPIVRKPGDRRAATLNSVGNGNIWIIGFEFQGDAEGFRTNGVVEVLNGVDVRFSRCKFRGVKLLNPAALGYPAGHYDSWTLLGLNVAGSTRVTVDFCDFRDLGNGIVFRRNGSGGTGCVDCVGFANNFTQLTEDAMRFSHVTRLLYGYGIGYEFRPAYGGGTGNDKTHNDLIQFVSEFTGDVALDVNLIGNLGTSEGTYFFDDPTRQQFLQVIFLKPTSDNNPTLNRVLIQDNEGYGPGTWMVECKSGDNVLVRRNKGYRSDNPLYDASVAAVIIRTVNGDTATFSGNVGQYIGGSGSGEVTQTSVTDDGTNVIDNVERSDAQFAAMEATWRAARTAAIGD